MRSVRLTRSMRDRILERFDEKYLEPKRKEIEEEKQKLARAIYTERLQSLFPEVSVESLPQGLVSETTYYCITYLDKAGDREHIYGRFPEPVRVPEALQYGRSVLLEGEKSSVHASVHTFAERFSDVDREVRGIKNKMNDLLLSCYSFQSFKDKYPDWADFCPDADAEESAILKENLPDQYRPADVIKDMLAKLDGK